nr:hypothetical protein [Nanoarchaeum sp.]
MEKEQEEIEEENGYLYVYGITNKNVKLEMKGLKDRPIKEINFKDISALTSLYPTLHPMLEEEEAMQHANILKEIAKKTTVIPMSLGTVFKDQEILEIILSKSYKAIKETIALIDNKIELGVKIIKNQLDDIDNGIALEILEPLNKLSVKSVKGDNFSDRLLLNHSFLVEKNKFSKFSDKIAELENKHKNLKFIYTGPWPPHSFVNIKISGS